MLARNLEFSRIVIAKILNRNLLYSRS